MSMEVQISSSEVIARFKNLPDKLNQKLTTTIYSLTEKLRTHIVRDKLMGQVLKRQTGRLGQSIQTEVTQTANSTTGLVYSAGDVKYAAIHEYGGIIPAHVIEVKNGKALAFMMGGKMAFYKKVNHPATVMPERSFMRSALADMSDEITEAITAAVGEVASE